MHTPRPDRLLALAVAATVLAGCGNEPAPAPTAVASDTASSSTAPASSMPTVDRQITVSIVKGKVTPATGRVEVSRASTVLITVTCDVADELHVHGYDRTAKLAPGVPASVFFLRADTTGLFDVETHHTDLVLFQLVVR